MKFRKDSFYLWNLCLLIGAASLLRISMPGTGVVGDERTRKAGAKAALYALLILLGCLLLLGVVESFWIAARNSRLTPFILADIGIFSWGVIGYYFLKKGDVE